MTDAATARALRTIKYHGPEGFEGMRRAGRLAAEVLDALVPLVVPGASTLELADFARDMILAVGAELWPPGSVTVSSKSA